MPKKIPKAVRSEEFIDLIKCIPQKDKTSKVAFLLAYGSGLRVSEVVNLKPENIDTPRNIISVWGGKGGVDRTVPLPKGFKRWMLDCIPINKSIRTLERKFKKYSKMAKLPDYYVFHSLRHGFATRLLESGVPINQVQVLMGHSDISTTGIYLKARPQDALKSYEELF